MTDTPETTIIPEIIDEPCKAGCLNDMETIGYLAAEISRLRGKIKMLGIRYAAAEMHHETNMQEVIEERDRLAEALLEMQYDRSDKAIKMANELLQSFTRNQND
jgi:shikimate kinase